MDYYHDLVTQKSWEELQNLKKLIKFILIGGWAIYIYTRSLKSKDIDIIVDFKELPMLSKHYTISKNERLKKYEARKEEVQIDIYLPFYSNIGVPVEELIKHTRSIEGFTVLDANYLLVLKLFTLAKRGRSPKGRKDFIDTIALVKHEVIDWSKVKEIIKKYSLQELIAIFKGFLDEHFDVPELNLNRHYFAMLKKKIINQSILFS